MRVYEWYRLLRLRPDLHDSYPEGLWAWAPVAGHIVKMALNFFLGPLTSVYGLIKGATRFFTPHRYFYSGPFDTKNRGIETWDKRARTLSASFAFSRIGGVLFSTLVILSLFGVLTLSAISPYLAPVYIAGFAKGFATAAFWQSAGNLLLISGVANMVGRGIGGLIGKPFDFCNIRAMDEVERNNKLDEVKDNNGLDEVEDNDNRSSDTRDPYAPISSTSRIISFVGHTIEQTLVGEAVRPLANSPVVVKYPAEENRRGSDNSLLVTGEDSSPPSRNARNC